MNLPSHHSAFFSRIIKLIALASFLLCFSLTTYAQNAKGDKPVSNKGKMRDVRFKTRSKQGDKARTKDVAGRRVRTKNKSSANQAAVNYQVPVAARW